MVEKIDRNSETKLASSALFLGCKLAKTAENGAFQLALVHFAALSSSLSKSFLTFKLECLQSVCFLFSILCIFVPLLFPQIDKKFFFVFLRCLCILSYYLINFNLFYLVLVLL